MEVDVYATDGSLTGRTVKLDERVFGAEPNDHVLWLDVRRTQASARQGTHKTKERSEVRGSTRKLYRQKGTGRARTGPAKSPLRRGGGRTFGPRPRTYRLRLSKKTRRLARRSALAYKTQEGAIRLIEPLEFTEPSTASLAGLLHALEVADRRVLVVTAAHGAALWRSSCNLSRVSVREARNVTAEDILRAATLVCEEGAVDVLVRILETEAATTP